MWINLTYQGCEIQNHVDIAPHNTAKKMVLLFYPKAPIGGSNLVFIHNGTVGDWPSDCIDTDTVELIVEEGDIVIIDNTTLHAVDAHLPNEPRMCIAIEFSLY